MIRLAITEQHAIVRWALREALSKIEDLEIVGDAGSVGETLQLIQATKPDVLLLDLTLPDHTGADLLTQVRGMDEAPTIVLLASKPASEIEAAYAARALAAGAHGYVERSATPDQLLEAIRAVSRGERSVPPNVEAMLATNDSHPASVLTNRELQVMELLARGMTNAEIAEHLGISVKTVDTHRGHVMKKLHLRNNSELTRFAVRHGYVSL